MGGGGPWHGTCSETQFELADGMKAVALAAQSARKAIIERSIVAVAVLVVDSWFAGVEEGTFAHSLAFASPLLAQRSYLTGER